jgi:hypothetical protein
MSSKKVVKINYDMEAIACINTLKHEKRIKKSVDCTRVYYELTGKEISPSVISRKVNDFIFITEVDGQQKSTINIPKYQDYLGKCKDILSSMNGNETQQENTSAETEENVVLKQLKDMFPIPEADLVRKFDVDLEKDNDIEIQRKISSKLGDPIIFLEYLGFDPSFYEVKHFRIKGWTTIVKEEKLDGTKVAVQKNNYGIDYKIGLRKQPIYVLTPEKLEEYFELALRRAHVSPYDLVDAEQYFQPIFPVVSTKYANRLMVCPGLELHIGKLAAVSDLEDYSTGQAMARLGIVFDELIKYQYQQQASKLILGIGNDYFNSDNPFDQTTAGTQQHNDSRFKEIGTWGTFGMQKFIEGLQKYFDGIILKNNPGNHDEMASFNLYMFLCMLFLKTNNQKVSGGLAFKDLRSITGYTFGDYFVAFHHGKSGNSKPISDRRAVEQVRGFFHEETSRAKHTYIFMGHLHQDSQTVFSLEKTTVIRTAALVGIDDYHAENGFISARQGHSLYVIDDIRGLVNAQRITLTEEEKRLKIGKINRDPNADIPTEMAKVLNLSSEVAEQKIVEDEIKRIDDIQKKFMADEMSRKNRILKTIKSGKLSRKEILELSAALSREYGSDEQIGRLEEQKQIIKRYKYPQSEEQVI